MDAKPADLVFGTVKGSGESRSNRSLFFLPIFSAKYR